jgi:hypothetical protein
MWLWNYVLLAGAFYNIVKIFIYSEKPFMGEKRAVTTNILLSKIWQNIILT